MSERVDFEKLREPFPQEAIGTITRGGVELPFIGHAWVTERLLQIDPHWCWEPLAFDERGLPLIVERGPDFELWIRLRIGDVTRIGVGTVPKTARGEIAKQLVSDALRNAAMRFGVALELWKVPVDDPEATHRDPVVRQVEKLPAKQEETQPPLEMPDLATVRRTAKDLLFEAVGGDQDAARKIWKAEGFENLRADRLLEAVEVVVDEIRAVGIDGYLAGYEAF